MRFINEIDEALHRSECVKPNGDPAISLRRLEQNVMRKEIREDDLQRFFIKYKSYTTEEIEEICNKIYHPTPKDDNEQYYVRLK